MFSSHTKQKHPELCASLEALDLENAQGFLVDEIQLHNNKEIIMFRPNRTLHRKQTADGVFIEISPEGKVDIGCYADAVPRITDGVFHILQSKQFASQQYVVDNLWLLINSMTLEFQDPDKLIGFYPKPFKGYTR